MTTPLLNITTVAAGSASKEALISQGFVDVEDALQRGLTLDFTAGNITLTSTQWRRNYYFICTNVPVARDLIVPLSIRVFSVKNNGANNVTVRGATGSTVVMNPGSSALLFNSGTGISIIIFTLAETSPHDVALFIPGVPPDGELVARYEFIRAASFASNFTGSRASSAIASTSNAVFDIQKNGSSVGSLTFSSSATGVFSTAGVVSFAVGDILSIISPTPLDATLESVSISLLGVRI